MRKLLLVLALVTAVPSFASPSHQYCENQGEIYVLFHQLRQAGAPMDVPHKHIVDTTEAGSKQRSDLFKLQYKAYSEPKFDNKLKSLRHAEYYRNQVVLDCYESAGIQM